MQLLIAPLGGLPRAADGVEIVERKGLGHPDTICDALAERLSVALCRYYLEHFDLVLHHNVDKVLLWAGVSRPEIGGGEIIEPMEVFLAGRASLSFKGVAVPVAEIAESTCKDWFREHFHALDPEAHVKIHSLVRPGSIELVDLFMQQKKTGVWLANDTSFGVGFAPLSGLERATLGIENTLNSDAVKSAHPQLGRERIYITVTGTSAESGDDGEAGRGNRANGLITPFRPMALEAVAGKNPITHVGKLYNVAAGNMAAALVEELPEVLAAQCVLVSQIGRPVMDPQTVAVHLRSVDGQPLEALTPRIRECVGAQLVAIATLWERMIREEVPLY
jgi:S-adenosylmethionine synthetase